MVILRNHLSEMLNELKKKKEDIFDKIDITLEHIESNESKVESLILENDRVPRIRKEAKELLDKYSETDELPTLFGALVGVKDIFHVDGFLTKAGSNLPPEILTGKEARCVKLLKEAGALILGKTVTTEFAYFEPGPTKNPYNLGHTPGGSSSGSAAAVAAGFCQIAFGTQTIGSIIRPAAFCGVFGYKPTYGRIPTTGLISFSKSVDHVGFFTQDIEGMITAASVLCSNWNNRKIKSDLPILGIPVGPYLEQVSKEGEKVFMDQVGKLKNAGYIIKEVNILEDIEEIDKKHRRLIAKELAQVHSEWFKEYKELYREKTKELIEQGLEVTDEEAEQARDERIKLRKEIEKEMEKQGIDLWITPPALGTAPKGIESTGNPSMNLPWTNTGMPSVNVPAGLTENNLPVGIQLVAKFMNDEDLLKWAKSIYKVL